MKNFFRKIKKQWKLSIGIIISAFLVSLAVFPALGLKADSPRFNFMQGDAELLTGANVTNSESVWKDPIVAESGDTFEGLVYYHNGILDSVAKNTKIKVNLPSETSNSRAVLTASISADNAETVTDTVVNGSIVGKSGLTVNFDENTELELVPGSVKWYPEVKNHNNQYIAYDLPYNQSGNEITTVGINIGDIKGCWEYAGYVKFAVKTTKAVIPANVTLTKSVRNVSDHQTTFSQSTEANASEEVEFQVVINNTADGIAKNVKISDVFPAGLEFVHGSVKVDYQSENKAFSESEFLGSGFVFSQIGPKTKVIITFLAKAPANISVQKTETNKAILNFDSKTLTDTADVVLKPLYANIIRCKSAYNVTQGIDATKVAAKPGDIIEYKLFTKNTGDIATEVTVSDGIGDVIEYAKVISMSTGGKLVSGAANTNDSTMIQYPTKTVLVNQTLENSFKVQVKDPLPTNPQSGYHYDFTMYNVYGNEIIIHIVKPNPVMTIEKSVRNVTAGESSFVNENSAYGGETIEYKVVFKNVGKGPAYNVKISDVLPVNVYYVGNSTKVTFLGKTKTIDNVMKSSYVISVVNPNESGYIVFQAKVSASIAGGEKLVNSAYLSYNNKKISDTAVTKTKVKTVAKEEPALPKTGADTIAIAAAFSSLIVVGIRKFAFLKI